MEPSEKDDNNIISKRLLVVDYSYVDYNMIQYGNILLARCLAVLTETTISIHQTTEAIHGLLNLKETFHSNRYEYRQSNSNHAS